MMSRETAGTDNRLPYINSSTTEQNGRHFISDIFKQFQFISIQFKNVYCHTNTIECIQYIYAYKEHNTYMPIRKVSIDRITALNGFSPDSTILFYTGRTYVTVLQAW